MNDTPKKITSFTVDHRTLSPGIYVSRVDGDVTTYDLRHRAPNRGDYISPLAAHSLEHMFATYIRSSAIGERVIYYGPMGCLTGFYLLVRSSDNTQTLAAIKDCLRKILVSDTMFGGSDAECGNYRMLDLACAKDEAARYLATLDSLTNPTFGYDKATPPAALTLTAIICAMDIEAERIVAAGTVTSHERAGGGEFHTVEIDGRRVIVATCGIGKVAAAAATQRLIDKYGVSSVINSGIAGSLGAVDTSLPNLKIGEIVIADFVVQHDCDTTAFGDPPGLICPLMTVKIDADRPLVEKLLAATEELGYTARIGGVASGDQFITLPEKKRWISSTFGMVACDMEGAAVAEVCRLNGVRFAVIRAVSDGEGELLDYQTFKRHAADRSADAIIKVLGLL